MDRQRWILRFAVFALCSTCAGNSQRGRLLGAGQVASAPALSLGTPKVISKNALAYRVAIAGETLVSIELGTEFELVMRTIPGSKIKTETRRVRIDSATYDINDLVVDEKSDSAYVASSAGWVRHYDLKTLEVRSEWRTGSAATALALDPQSQTLLVGTASGVVCLRRLRDSAQLQCMVAHAGRIASLAVSKGRLASASWRGEVVLWGLPALNKILELENTASVADLAFSLDGTLLAVTRNRRPPLRSQAVNDAEKKSFQVDPLGVNRIEIHKIRESGTATTLVHSLVGHRALIASLCWIGSDLLSGSWDRTVQLWDSKSGLRTEVLGDFRHIIRDVSAQQVQSGYAIAGWGPTGSM